MKYMKLFMIAAATVFCAASCSDDENYNTTGKTTIEFESTAMTVDENTDLFDVPVKVSGARNGKVRFVIKTEEVGENPAKEDVNYMVTSKTISLSADTLTNSTMNVQVKAVDDRNMNADRTFKLTIVSADGATIGGNSSVTVTLKDNDTSYFNIFSGEWKITGKFHYIGDDGKTYVKEFSQNMSISSPSDEDNFESRLYAYIPSWSVPNVPLTLSYEFPIRYRYIESTKKGTFAFESGVEAATNDYYGLAWSFNKWANGTMARGNFSANWTPTEDNSVPEVIEFDTADTLAILETGAGAGIRYGCVMSDVKIKRRN